MGIVSALKLSEPGRREADGIADYLLSLSNAARSGVVIGVAGVVIGEDDQSRHFCLGSCAKNSDLTIVDLLSLIGKVSP
jgi:hypothetical protein